MVVIRIEDIHGCGPYTGGPMDLNNILSYGDADGFSIDGDYEVFRECRPIPQHDIGIDRDPRENKIAVKIEKKSIVSLGIRRRRIAGSKNPGICDECGYRIRTENHMNGGHHNGNTGRS